MKNTYVVTKVDVYDAVVKSKAPRSSLLPIGPFFCSIARCKLDETSVDEWVSQSQVGEVDGVDAANTEILCRVTPRAVSRYAFPNRLSVL